MTGLVLWAHRRRALVLACAAGLLVASLLGLRGLTFDADVLRLLPRDGRHIPAFRTYLQHFGTIDQLYLVFTAPEGHSIRDYADHVDAWADALRATPEIDRVDTGTIDPSRDWNYLGDRQLLLMDDDTLTRALERLQPAGMPAALAESRELLAVPSAAVTDLVRQDPLGLLTLMRDALGGSASGLNLGVSEDGYVSGDGRQRLLIARPARPPYDTDFSHALMDRLAVIEADLQAQAAAADADLDPADRLPPFAVEVAGGHRIAVETEAVVRRESVTNSVGSLALILPLLFLVFRSPWLVAVGAVPSALSLLLVLGALGWAGATLSAAATGAAAMLFGLGVDGVVLLYVAHRLAIDEGATPEGAVAGTGGPSSSMLLGMWTTAATFYGLMVVDFPSLEQLGRLIGHSMVLCGLLTLFLVPAMLPRRIRSSAGRRLTMERLASFVSRNARGVLLAALALSILFGLAATRLRVNPTLERLRSVTPGAQLEEQIAESFGLPTDVYVALAEGPALEPLLRQNESLVDEIRRSQPDVPVHAPAVLLPSDAAQAARATRVVRSLPPPGALHEALRASAADAGFRPDSFAPFEERLPRLVAADARLTYEGYAAHGLGDIIGRFVVRADDGWRLATYLFPRTAGQVAGIESIVEGAEGVTLTGLPLVNRELAARFTPQFLLGLGAGSAIVIVLILVTFRNVQLSLLSLLPTAVGLVWAAGVMAVAGIELDLFAVFAVLTFVGIGVDYGIHLVHRYQERGNAERACAELAPVILVAGAITFLGYGTLVTSSYPPLRSIGLVSAVSVVTLIAASLFVLPALLAMRKR